MRALSPEPPNRYGVCVFRISQAGQRIHKSTTPMEEKEHTLIAPAGRNKPKKIPPAKNNTKEKITGRKK